MIFLRILASGGKKSQLFTPRFRLEFSLLRGISGSNYAPCVYRKDAFGGLCLPPVTASVYLRLPPSYRLSKKRKKQKNSDLYLWLLAVQQEKQR